MADPTNYTALTASMLGTPDNPVIYVDQQVSATGTSILATSPGFADYSGTALTTPFMISILYVGGDYNGYRELAKVTAISADKLTATVTRGMPRDGKSIDTADAVAALAKIIPKGSIIEIAPIPQQQAMVDDALAGSIGATLKFNAAPTWDTSATDVALSMPIYADATARDAAITTPTEGMKVKLTSEGIISSYVGGTWVSEGTDTTANGSTTVAGKYEAATAAERAAATATGGTGALLIPTNDALVKTSSGAGDENKIPILDSSGQLASGFMPTNIKEADTFFEDTDMTGAEAEALTNGSKVASTKHYHGERAVLSGSRSASSGDGTQTIAHGLTETPRSICISAVMNGRTTTDMPSSSNGFSNGTTNKCVSTKMNTFMTGDASTTMSTTKCVDVKSYSGSGAAHQMTATATFDGTNITLTWDETTTSSPSDMTVNFVILAEY